MEFILESNRYSPDAWNISALLCHAGIIGTKGCLVTSTERLAHILAWLRTKQHTHTPKVISEAKSFYWRSTKAVGGRCSEKTLVFTTDTIFTAELSAPHIC